MHSCECLVGKSAWQDHAPLHADAEVAAQDGPCSRGPQGNQHPWLDELDLLFEPGQARRDLARSGRLVHAPLALGIPLEVLDHVGDVDVTALETDAGASL